MVRLDGRPAGVPNEHRRPSPPRCVEQRGPQAPEKAEKFKAVMGGPCMILECAISKGVDHCSRCDEFPCDIHYKQEVYSHKLLNIIKGMLGK